MQQGHDTIRLPVEILLKLQRFIPNRDSLLSLAFHLKLRNSSTKNEKQRNTLNVWTCVRIVLKMFFIIKTFERKTVKRCARKGRTFFAITAY